MNKEIRILLVEDSSHDALLIDHELRKSGLVFRSRRVETREDYLEQLEQATPDLILLDHGLPTFDGFTALALARDRIPDVPLIFVTGSLGEETVLKTLKSGATDYVLKHHLSDLAPAVHRALRVSEERAKRRQAEYALRRSEERFRLLVENVADYAIYMLDVEGRIATWNTGAERIEGYRAEEIMNQPVWMLDRADSGAPKKWLQILYQAETTGRYLDEGWQVRPDGTRAWISMVITPLRNEAGALYGFAKVSRDMTAQKRAADALQESEERFRRLVELSPEALLVYCTGRIVFANPAALRLLGASHPDQLIGQLVESIVHPDHRDMALERIRRLNAREIDFNPFMEQKVLRLDGTPVDVEMASSFLHYQEQPAVQAIMHDITERKRAEVQIQSWNTELEHRVALRTAQLSAANQELEAFSYSVSHDLRAPLRHIDGFIEILRGSLDMPLNESAAKALDTIVGASAKMGSLIEHLLEFSRMTRAELCRTPFNMRLLVDKVRADLEPECANRSVEWQIQPLPEVKGDPNLLRQVWFNLVANALKYSRTRPQSRIEIGVRDSDDDFIFFVRDNGVGFDAQYAQKLFGVFQRLHSPREFEGTGVGLAIVRRIVARHGGRTWAESTVDQGATFYFSLPKNPATE